MESEYVGLGWLSRKKTIICPLSQACGLEEDTDDYFEEYSFEEASIYLNSFTVNQMAAMTRTVPSRRMLNSTSTICRRAMISPFCMILGLAYAKQYHKVCSDNKSAVKLSALDLFLVSMILSNKFLIDNGEYEAISNREWAKLSNKSVQEVNTLETQFLDAIEWRLYMSPQEFSAFSREIEAQVVTDLVKRRGYCTYGEMLSLFKWEDFNAKFHTSVRNMGLAFLSSFAFYLTGVLALSVAVKGLNCLSQVSNRNQVQQQAHSTIERREIVLTNLNSSPDVQLQRLCPQSHPTVLSDLYLLANQTLTHKTCELGFLEYSSICDRSCTQLLSPLDLATSPPYSLVQGVS